MYVCMYVDAVGGEGWTDRVYVSVYVCIYVSMYLCMYVQALEDAVYIAHYLRDAQALFPDDKNKAIEEAFRCFQAIRIKHCTDIQVCIYMYVYLFADEEK